MLRDVTREAVSTSLSSTVAPGVDGAVEASASVDTAGVAAADTRSLIRGNECSCADSSAGLGSFEFLSLRPEEVDALLGFTGLGGLGAAGLRTAALSTTMPANGLRHLARPTSGDRYHTGPFGRVGPSNALGWSAGASTASAVDPASWYFVNNTLRGGVALAHRDWCMRIAFWIIVAGATAIDGGRNQPCSNATAASSSGERARFP
jgi:hypothetical protein